MTQSTPSDSMLTFTIIVSAFGLFTILVFALYPQAAREEIVWRQILVGSIFVLVCTSGAIAVLIPKKCLRIFPKISRTVEPSSVANKYPERPKAHVKVKGHHPACGKFSAHTIHVNNHVLCAACTGLFFGAVAAVAGAALYFFTEWDIGQVGLPAILFGQVGIALGLIQYKFKGYTRLTVNALFVFAVLLILVGIDTLVMNLLVDLYSIILTCFWLLTRITISQWDHRRICQECGTACMMKERES